MTGASRGLGQTFARALARAGADLVITSRTLDSLTRVPGGDRVARPPGRAARARRPQRGQHPRDGRRRGTTRSAAIDILVNNAGCNVRKPALDVTWDDWNLDARHESARHVLRRAGGRAPHDAARQRGRIINIGSVTSVFGYAGLGPYGASRGGIRQLTMSLADDWGPHGITVNCLAPGWFKTDQNKVLYDDPEWVEYLVDRIPLRRPGRPERSRRGRRVSRVGRQRVHHRADAAGRRRDVHWRRAGVAAKLIVATPLAAAMAAGASARIVSYQSCMVPSASRAIGRYAG